MSPPTFTGLFIRNTRDADTLFFAVYEGRLPMCNRRLDNTERMSLRSGCVYVWEESDSETDPHGIKRFTEGRSWEPSRLRDSFLIYLEKDDQQTSPLTTQRQRTSYHHSPYSPFTHRGMIKKTYSVYVDTNNGRKKWHLNAYYTEDTIEQLRTVDEIYQLHDLARRVPQNLFKCARTTRFEEDSSPSPTARAAPAPFSSPVPISRPPPLPSLTTAHFTYGGHSRRSSGSSASASPASQAPLSSPDTTPYVHHHRAPKPSYPGTIPSYLPSQPSAISVSIPRRYHAGSTTPLPRSASSGLERQLSGLQLIPIDQLHNSHHGSSSKTRPRDHIEEEMLRRFS